jgi:hypothetical protein
MIHTLPILTAMASVLVAHPATTLPAQVPERLDVPAQPAIRQFTAGIEEPGLYALLRAVQNLPGPPASQPVPVSGPSAPATSLAAPEQTTSAAPFDRAGLLADPQGQVGELLPASAQFIETKAIHLASAPPPLPATIWSTLVLEQQSRQPVQVLTLAEPVRMSRLANVSCLGYFYKIRQDKAQKPGPSGQQAVVDVPVIVGWVWPAPTTQPVATKRLAYYILPAVLGGVFVVFLLVAMAGRQRTDWRTRVRNRRRRWSPRGTPSDERSDGPSTYDQQ